MNIGRTGFCLIPFCGHTASAEAHSGDPQAITCGVLLQDIWPQLKSGTEDRDDKERAPFIRD